MRSIAPSTAVRSTRRCPIAQVAAELLADTTVPREQAQGHFQAALAAAYQKEHPEVAPDAAALSKAANTLNGIYLNDIYAAMKLGWNEHRSNLGHMAKGVTNPGCFRCHDGEHVATLANGTKKKLSRDCDTCHTGLAFDADPNKFDDTLAAMIPAAK